MPGDSPEICRSLDSHGFSTNNSRLLLAAVLSKDYWNDEHLQHKVFKTGVPMDLLNSLIRLWVSRPSSLGVQDVLGFDRVISLIIAADGAAVKEEGKRSGRRAQALRGNTSGGSKQMKGKIRRTQRKGTNVEWEENEDLIFFLNKRQEKGDAFIANWLPKGDSDGEVTKMICRF